MSAWRKLAALGLVASFSAISCTVSSGDDDETGGTGGTSASGGSSGSGGSTGGASGSGGSTGGTGGATGGASGTGGSAGTGGAGGIMCDPEGADECTACVETTCCTQFEACANDAICGYSEPERNEMDCQDACKAAICLGKRPDLTTCDAATVAAEVTTEEAAECTTYCVPGGTPSAGEFMCFLGCLQGATVALNAWFDSSAATCGAACISDNSSLGTLSDNTTNLTNCIQESCTACGITPPEG